MSDLLEKARIYGLKTLLSFAIGEAKYLLIDRLIWGSYSQMGEDLLVDGLLSHKPVGFYVDIGANHPTRCSNTAMFYRRGWSGINIEPNTEQYKLLVQDRSRDVNLNMGIGSRSGTLLFYKFIPDGYSTFSEEQAEVNRQLGFRLVEAVNIEVRRLDEVLTENCDNRAIDFMSIDTEGFDREVLVSNDWQRFRPTVIVIESAQAWSTAASTTFGKCERILTGLGYEKVGDTGLNSIFRILRPIGAE